MSNSLAERFDDDAGGIEVAGKQPLAERGAGDLEPARAQIRDRRNRRHLDLLFRRRLHGAEQAVLARLGERDRGPAAAGASGPADAVQVGVGRGRHVVVDDMREPLDVEPARGDVGRHEDVHFPLAKAAHHALALALFQASVERVRAVAVRVEQFDERVDFEPRAAEDERRVRILRLEDAFERRRLVGPGHDVGDLTDARQLAGCRRFAGDR